MINRNGMSGMLAGNSSEWHATHAGRLTHRVGILCDFSNNSRNRNDIL